MKELLIDNLTKRQGGKYYIYLYVVSILAIFSIVYYPAYYVPFHSDDYSYFLQGNSFAVHLTHYLSWSGRFITDYISSTLLVCFSKPVYMAINSLVVVIVIASMTSMPRIVMKQNFIGQYSWLMLWFLFALYWIANPTLGQTTFWLVGSANYLWPSMWASLYLLLIFNLLAKEKEANFKNSIFIIFFGFFAGFSNEATGVSILLVTMLLFFIYRQQKNILLIAFVSVLVGFAFLYFAPGNSVRLSNPAFATWVGSPLPIKVFYHMLERTPEALSGFWLIYIEAILFIGMLAYFEKNKEANSSYYLFSFIFFIIAIFSVLIFIKSPAMPPRSYSTSLFFLLISMSFLVNIVISLKNRIAIGTLFLILLVNAMYFIPSYVFFTYAIKKTSIQGQIREDIIDEAKLNRKQSVKIPDWYFTRLLKDADKFDMYRSNAMPKYYNINNIEWTNVYFDYSILKTQKPILLDLPLTKDLKLKAIFYSDGHKVFDKNMLILQFNKSPLKYIKNGDDILYVHVYPKNGEKFINKDIDLNEVSEINSNFYYAIPVDKSVLSESKYINFGFYNSKTQQNSASFILNLDKLKI